MCARNPPPAKPFPIPFPTQQLPQPTMFAAVVFFHGKAAHAKEDHGAEFRTPAPTEREHRDPDRDQDGANTSIGWKAMYWTFSDQPGEGVHCPECQLPKKVRHNTRMVFSRVMGIPLFPVSGKCKVYHCAYCASTLNTDKIDRRKRLRWACSSAQGGSPTRNALVTTDSMFSGGSGLGASFSVCEQELSYRCIIVSWYQIASEANYGVSNSYHHQASTGQYRIK